MTVSPKILMAVLLSCSGIVGAAEPSLMMNWFASSDPSTPYAFNPADIGDVTPDQNGGLIFTGSLLDDSWQMSWTTRIRNTPGNAYIDSGISVINLSSETQIFSLDTRMLLSDPLSNPGNVDLSGSLALTNTDFIGTAQTTDSNGQSIINSSLNNISSSSLFDGPYLLQANGPFSSAVDSSSTSMIPSVAMLDEMSLLTTFTLSPGDLLNLTIVMDVANVPAPAVLSMLALAGLASGRPRRRQTASKSAVQ